MRLGCAPRPIAHTRPGCAGASDILFAHRRPEMLAHAAPRHGAPDVLGSDFCHPMLTQPATRSPMRRRGCAFEPTPSVCPSATKSLDLITWAFGFTLVNYTASSRFTVP